MTSLREKYLGKNAKVTDKKAARAGMTKEQLRAEHVRLVAREKELQAQVEEVKVIFQNLAAGYQTSKEAFSLQRYGQLKALIKAAVSEAYTAPIRKALGQEQEEQKAAKGGLAGLLSKAKMFSTEQPDAGRPADGKQGSQAAAAPAKQSSKTGSKMAGFFKKVKDITGFSDEPVADEDVMTETELSRDSDRKSRAIQRHVTFLTRALGLLDNLKEQYEASKAHAPPTRYTELKDMIKAATSDKLVS